jgi:hypothetical protein
MTTRQSCKGTADGGQFSSPHHLFAIGGSAGQVRGLTSNAATPGEALIDDLGTGELLTAWRPCDRARLAGQRS